MTEELLEKARLVGCLEDLEIVSELSPVLAPERWPFDVSWLPASACLVGGSVRNALLGHQSSYLDLDFVMPIDAVKTARKIARHYKAGFVLLDAERQIARVVFPESTVDFAAQVGETLVDDLWRRDFTVNAIAYNPHTDQLIDPLRGYADLQKRQIRMVAPENLADDPLRLLRAYRQAAQLGFTIEPETRAEIRRLAPALDRIAAERIQSELNYLLSSAKGTPWLFAAFEDRLFRHWLPDAARAIQYLSGSDRAVAHIQEQFPDLPIQAAKASGSSRAGSVIAKLSSLVSADPVVAEQQLRHLKYSRAEIQAVTTLLRSLPTFLHAVSDPSWGPRQQCLFFKEVGATFPSIALVAIAMGAPMPMIHRLIQRFLDPNDAIAHASALVSGQELMRSLSVSAGPPIGRLLAELQLAHAEGQFQTAEGAVQWAKQWLRRT